MTSLSSRMAEDIQVRNLSPHTQDSYIQQVFRFDRHCGRHPALPVPRHPEDELGRRGGRARPQAAEAAARRR